MLMSVAMVIVALVCIFLASGVEPLKVGRHGEHFDQVGGSKYILGFAE